jgi:hypothetical protein
MALENVGVVNRDSTDAALDDWLVVRGEANEGQRDIFWSKVSGMSLMVVHLI